MNDSFKIEKVGVLGMGVMGAQIAAHLTNAKIPATIARCIAEYPDPDVLGQDIDMVMGVLTENGFNVQEFG